MSGGNPGPRGRPRDLVVIAIVTVVVVGICAVQAVGATFLLGSWLPRPGPDRPIPECRDGYVVAEVRTPRTARHHTVCITGYIP